MQSPSLSLMSLFGAQSTAADASVNGLLETLATEENSDFLAMFNDLLGKGGDANDHQNLPLALTVAAAAPSDLPLAMADLPAAEGTDEVGELTPEQVQLLQNLLAQMNMQELQQTPKMPAATEDTVDVVEQAETAIIATPMFNDTVVRAANEPAQHHTTAMLANSNPVAAQANLKPDSQGLASDVQFNLAEAAQSDAEQLDHIVNKPTALQANNALAAGLEQAPGTGAQNIQTLQPSIMNAAATAISAEAQQQTQAHSLASAATSSVAVEQGLQQQLAATARMQFGPDTQQWGGALASRIVTMIAEDVQQARIHLDPPELGSLEIKLQIQNQQATVHIQAQHGQVRDVLEAHAQRLRESLAEQGIDLSDFDVSEQSQQQGGQQQYAEAEQAKQGGGAQQGQEAADGWLSEDDDSLAASTNTVSQSLNLLDTYA